MKKIISAILIIVAVFSLAACKEETFKDGEVTFHADEMSITLPANFQEVEIKEENQSSEYKEFRFNSGYHKIKIKVFKYEKDKLKEEANMSIGDFFNTKFEEFQNDGAYHDLKKLTDPNNLPYFQYYEFENAMFRQTSYGSYYNSVFESDNAFWHIKIQDQKNDFVNGEFDKNKSDFFQWMQTVTFTDKKHQQFQISKE